MPRVNFICLVAISLFVFQVAEGNEVRNGGSFLNCDGELQLLDLYEATAVWDLPLENLEELLSPSDNFNNIRSIEDAVVYAAQVMGRLDSLDPIRVANYRATLFSLVDNSSLIDKAILPPVDDFGPVAIPQGCELLQAASQALPRFEGEEYFAFSDPIWQRLSSLQKIALIIHEIVLFDELKRGERTSRSARYLTGLLFSKKLSEMDESSYALLLSTANISPPLKLSRRMRILSDIFSRLTGRILNSQADGMVRILNSVFLGQNSIYLEVDLRTASDLNVSMYEKLFFFEVDQQIYLRIETERSPVEIPIHWVGKVTLSDFDTVVTWDVNTTLPFNESQTCTVVLPNGGSCAKSF